MLIEIKEQPTQITSSMIAADIFRKILSFENEVDRDKEHFWAIGLNKKNVILYVELVSLGTLDSSLVSPREVFRMAILKAAASIMVGHNHPSNDVTPSYDDQYITDKLRDSGKILGIHLLDHVIIGNDEKRYVSLMTDPSINSLIKLNNTLKEVERKRRSKSLESRSPL